MLKLQQNSRHATIIFLLDIDQKNQVLDFLLDSQKDSSRYHLIRECIWVAGRILGFVEVCFKI